jgi:hypothetical protein
MKNPLATTKKALQSQGVLDKNGSIAKTTGTKKNGDYQKITLKGHRYSAHTVAYLKSHPNANLQGKVVHHLSNNKNDNSPGNLVAMTQAAQAALHGVHNREEFNEWKKKWGKDCPDLAKVSAYYSKHLASLTRHTNETNSKNRLAMKSLKKSS